MKRVLKRAHASPELRATDARANGALAGLDTIVLEASPRIARYPR